jgi:hypothetical protein
MGRHRAIVQGAERALQAHRRLDIGLRPPGGKGGRRKSRLQEGGGVAQFLDGDSQPVQTPLVERAELVAAPHGLVVALVEHGAGEFVEALVRAGGWQGDEGLELAVKALEAGARQGGAGALEMGLGQPVGDPLHGRRHVLHGFVEKDMEVARRRAFAGQPFGLGRERAHDRAVDGAPEQPKGGAQAAQRHSGLVDADRPAALQGDSAILQKVGMALPHDVPQRDIGGGVGGEAGSGLSHFRPDRSGRRGPGNRKERHSDEGFIAAVQLQFVGVFWRFRLPAMRLAGRGRGRFRWRPTAGLP